MGLFKRLTGRASTSAEVEEPPIEMPRKKSSFVVPSSEPVTEASLKVFRGLPQTIRHDPSMISFQQEHERWKGKRKFNLLVRRLHHRCFSQPVFIFYRFFIAFVNMQPVGRQFHPFHFTILTSPFYVSFAMAFQLNMTTKRITAAPPASGCSVKRTASMKSKTTTRIPRAANS